MYKNTIFCIQNLFDLHWVDYEIKFILLINKKIKRTI
nr:MAG TPA: hypothetical protein [Caudoviricetes sp.]